MPTKKKKAPAKRTPAKRTPAAPSTKEFGVVWVDINSVKLWKDNPRKDNPDAVKKLAKLIKENGLRSPLNVWEKDMVIYKGNHTYQALKLLGRTRVPVIMHKFKDADAAAAYGLSDNKASEWTGWDDEKMEALYAKQQDKEILVERTGFSVEDLALFGDKEIPDLPDVDLNNFKCKTDAKNYVVLEFSGTESKNKFMAQFNTTSTRALTAEKLFELYELRAGAPTAQPKKKAKRKVRK